MAVNRWSRIGTGTITEERVFGRKVGHVLRQHNGEWCALYDGVFLAAVPDPEQAKVIVQAAAEATR